MPNQHLEEPITKVTLNLFTADIEYLKSIKGYNYQGRIRNIVHKFCMEQRTTNNFLRNRGV